MLAPILIGISLSNYGFIGIFIIVYMIYTPITKIILFPLFHARLL